MASKTNPSTPKLSDAARILNIPDGIATTGFDSGASSTTHGLARSSSLAATWTGRAAAAGKPSGLFSSM